MALEMLPPPSVVESASEGGSSDTPFSGARLLTAEEIATLAPVFAEQQADFPNPELSFVIGTVDNGEVTAFLVIQMVVHAQPLWIKKGHEASFRSMVHAAEQILAERGGCNVYVFAPAGKVSKMAGAVGMRLEPWNVYSKHIEAAPIMAESVGSVQ